MKIAFLNIYSGLVNRGVERSISELAKRLSKNHEIRVFQGKVVKAGYPAHEIKINLDLQRIDQDTTGWKIFFSLLRYDRCKVAEFTVKCLPYLWKERFDIVIPTNGGWQSLICRILTWLQGTKLIITGRSGPGFDERLNLLCKPDAFVTLTPAHQKWAEYYFPHHKIFQIPNGVDIKKFSPHVKPLKIDLPEPIILTVGAITPWKRHELVLKAVERLPHVSWLLVGGGDEKYRNKFVKSAKQKLGNRFRWLKLPLAQMPQVYRAARLFTSAVRPQEAFGNVFLEALATNLPVVAPNDESRKYIVGNGGILVDPTNTKIYANALVKALDYDWRYLPRKQAEKFSWDKISRRYEALFKQII